jgi:hypothetical protein
LIIIKNERTTMSARHDKHKKFEENISPRAYLTYLLKCIKSSKNEKQRFIKPLFKYV